MKIFVKVKPNARINSVDKIGDNHFLVKVNSPPKENKANTELIATLSDYFKVPKFQIVILTGRNSSKKLIKIG